MKPHPHVLVLAVMACASSTLAQDAPPSRTYTETGHSWLSVAGTATARPTAVRFILGYNLGPNLAIESLAAFGATDGQTTLLARPIHGEHVMPVTVDVSLTHAAGLYLKPKFAPRSDIELFARLGWSDARFRTSLSTISATRSGNDFSYGAGASYLFARKWQLSLDHMSYYGTKGMRITGTTLGVGYSF